MLRLASLALALTLPAAAQSEASYRRQLGPTRDLGTYHAATRTWSRAQQHSALAPDAIYRNDAPSGYFGTGWEACYTIDEGILPGPTNPAGGSQDSYEIEGFQFSYCKQGGGTVDWFFGYLSAYTPCDDPTAPSHCLVEVPQYTLVSGLPGGSACWTFTVDLTGGLEVCLEADGGSCVPGYQGGGSNSDHVGLSFGWFTTDGGLTGPLLTGDPGWMPRGDGTCYRASYQNACGATVATGLGVGDIFHISDYDSFGVGFDHCSLGYSGCHFFGGYRSGHACGTSSRNPIAGFPFVLYADCTHACAPPLTTLYCDESQNPANVADIAIDTVKSSSHAIHVSLSSGPPQQFCYLLVGDGNATVHQPPGASGDLCVAGGTCLGRFAADVGPISGSGTFDTDLKQAASTPCNGAFTVTPGSTWNFQYWHRLPMGQPASFSSALEVVFQ